MKRSGRELVVYFVHNLIVEDMRSRLEGFQDNAIALAVEEDDVYDKAILAGRCLMFVV